MTPLWAFFNMAERFGVSPLEIHERWPPGLQVAAGLYCRLREAQEAKLEELKLTAGRVL